MLCDLDGVVWLAHHPIAGAVDAIAALQASGRRVLFVTNNSSATIATQERALADVGIDGDRRRRQLRHGRRAVAGAGPAGARGRRARGGRGARGARASPRSSTTASATPARSTPSSPACTVTSTTGGWRSAARALHRGARLIGTNADPTYPTPRGLDPGGGSILAAIATAGGVTPDGGRQAVRADGPRDRRPARTPETTVRRRAGC